MRLRPTHCVGLRRIREKPRWLVGLVLRWWAMATRRRSKTSRARRSKGRSGRRTSGRSRVAVRAAWRDDVNDQLRAHRPDALAILPGRGRGHRGARHLLRPRRSVRPGASTTAPPRCSAAAASSFPIVADRRRALADRARCRLPTRTTRTKKPSSAGRGWRLGIGFALTGLAAVGLMHLGHGNPHAHRSPRSSTPAASSARSSGAPLRAALGPAGAVIVLIAIGAFGLAAHRRHRSAPDRAAASRPARASSAARPAR